MGAIQLLVRMMAYLCFCLAVCRSATVSISWPWILYGWKLIFPCCLDLNSFISEIEYRHTDIYILWISWYLSIYCLGYLSFSYRFIGAHYLLDGTSFYVLYIAVTLPGFSFMSFFFSIITLFWNSLRHRGSCKISTVSSCVFFTQFSPVSYVITVHCQNQEIGIGTTLLSKLWTFWWFLYALAVVYMVLGNFIRNVGLSNHHSMKTQSCSLTTVKIPVLFHNSHTLPQP